MTTTAAQFPDDRIKQATKNAKAKQPSRKLLRRFQWSGSDVRSIFGGSRIKLAKEGEVQDG